MIKIDLHVHSSFSDGNLKLEQILFKAAQDNIKEIAITDHDTIANLRNYLQLGKKYNLIIIPGIEIPVDCDGIHILGYGIADFDKIEKDLLNLETYNEEQNIKTIKALIKQGIKINAETVRQQSTNNVITYRDIAKYLLKHNYVNSTLEAYEKFIGKNASAYFPSRKFSVKEVLQLIRDTNGISVLAHPFTLNKRMNLESIIYQLKNYGLDGIESCSPKMTIEQEEYYTFLAHKYNLIQTAGTDFHNSDTDFLGVEVSNDYLEKFNEKVLKRSN